MQKSVDRGTWRCQQPVRDEAKAGKKVQARDSMPVQAQSSLECGVAQPPFKCPSQLVFSNEPFVEVHVRIQEMSKRPLKSMRKENYQPSALDERSRLAQAMPAVPYHELRDRWSLSIVITNASTVINPLNCTPTVRTLRAH